MIKKIFFHADDFGRSKIISKNIYLCIKKKIINSLSIMIGFDETYFKKIKGNNNLNIRLHINLTEKYKNCSLIENYSFVKLFLIRFYPNFSYHKKIIIKEVEYQIIFFKKKFNLKKIQIDSHEHIHVIPWINEILVNMKKKHNIVELRNPIERYYYIKINNFINTKFLSNMVKFYLIKFFSIFHNIKKNTLIKKNFTGLLFTGFQNYDSITNGIINNYDLSKPIEVLIHPGFTNKKEIELFKKKYFDYYSSTERINEFKLASSSKMKKFLKKF